MTTIASSSMSRVYTLRHLHTHARFGTPDTILAFRKWENAVHMKKFAHQCAQLKQRDEYTYEIPMEEPEDVPYMIRPFNTRVLTIDRHELSDALMYYALNNLDCRVVEHMFVDGVKHPKLLIVTSGKALDDLLDGIPHQRRVQHLNVLYARRNCKEKLPWEK